jgi:hypothetical protein
MNRLGKYSFARHRQEARPAARAVLSLRRQQSLCIRVGRDLEPSSHDCRAMVVDRALADAKIGGDVLAGVSDKHQA